jgi:CelD/BcsL family acetyltransferase involved in cellulose biosynthesis
MNFGIVTMVTTNSASTIPLSVNEESRVTSVYEINPLRDPRWEAFVDSHSRASVFHSTNWLSALETAYGYDPLVVTTCSPDAALTNGLVFCRVDSWLTGRRFVSLPFSDHCEPLLTDSGELDALLLHIRRRADAGKWKYVEIRPISVQPRNHTRLVRSDVYSFHCLDLRKSIQELFHNFHKNGVQRKIRRAEREKLHYAEGCSEGLLQQFYDLQVMTRRRQYLPPQPLAWFRALIATFGGKLKIRVVTKDRVPIASILTLAHKKTMVYKYGCSDERFHKLGGVALLFWRAIQDAKDKGFDQFEMGRSDRNNLGLISFKEHWGAVGTELCYWKYPHRSGTTTDGWEKGALRNLVPITPDVFLRAMGTFLYKHVG